MSELPAGTITFLFTDIEGSTQRWEEQPELMRPALARHDALLHETLTAYGGDVFKTVGDAFHAAFASASAALAAAVAMQRALAGESWAGAGPGGVRMALYTGIAEQRDGDYFGAALNRAARLREAGHGGQVLLSRSTVELLSGRLPAGVDLVDLGVHRLRDLAQPEQIFQALIDGLPSEFPALRVSDQRPTNLPVPLSDIVGRDEDLAVVRRMLGTVRLVTLTGPGGTGKTRLALEAAHSLLPAFPDGVFFIDLATITEPELVAPTIAETLRLRETGGAPVAELLKLHLHDKQLLLVLDNFEQVTAAAPLVVELLGACASLKVLVTSRERLRLRGEHELPVAPLPVPDLRHLPPPDELQECSAVALFVARAQAVRRDFALTPQNAAAVAELCRRLDGLPLAIELAAARIKVLTPQGLLERLRHRLHVLAGGARDLPARQQTMSDTIAWSRNLLDDPEQILFRRLAVFVGGCTLDAAEAVCNAAGDLDLDILDGLASLADKSLLRQEEVDGESRFRMLQTIRAFAEDQLVAVGDAAAVRDRHRDWCLALAEEETPNGQKRERARRLEAEHDNIRAALAWCLEGDGGAEAGLRLAGAMGPFWDAHGHVMEGLGWLERALTAGTGAAQAVRARALGQAGRLAYRRADYARSASWLEESLAIYRELGDQRDVAAALNRLGRTLLQSGAGPRLMALYEESLALYRSVDDAAGVIDTLLAMGFACYYHGELDRAAPLAEESLALARAQPDRRAIIEPISVLAWVLHGQGELPRAQVLLEEALFLAHGAGETPEFAGLMVQLGMVLGAMGERDRALEYERESLKLYRQWGMTGGMLVCLVAIGGILCTLGQPKRGVRLFGAAQALYQALGATLPPMGRPLYERIAGQARADLGEAAFIAAFDAGFALPLDHAVSEALNERIAVRA